jgi:arachidonate 15-lipoxygenase
MPSLPQNDESPDRSAQLEAIRSQYTWDHDSLPPFALLKVEAGRGTGLLDMGSIMRGFFVGLPEGERASTAWLVAKAIAAMPPLLGLLTDVPLSEYIKLAADSSVAMKRQLPGWIDGAHASLMQHMEDRGEQRAFLPRTSEVSAIIEQLGLAVAGDLSVVIDDGDSLLGAIVGWLQSLLQQQKPIEGLSTQELIAQMEQVGAPLDAIRTVSLLQSLARLLAKKSADRGGAVEKMCTTLGVSCPPLDDQTLGWRLLAGPNPVVVRRVQHPADIPACFAVDDRVLRRSLQAMGLADLESRQATLADLIGAGRVFLTDYAILDGIPCALSRDRDFTGQLTPDETLRQRFLPAPLGLFLRWGEGLRPIAIQLGQDPAQYEVFTPADDHPLWERVKMLYLIADLNHHETATHLCGAHLILEGIAVTTGRQLHPDHPVAILLRPHLENVLWNNFLGKQILINPDGFMEQILSGELGAGSAEVMIRHYRQWTFSDLMLPEELAGRGVADTANLPVYPYRDDGLLLWDAIHAFVSTYLAVYYPTPVALGEDHELVAWLAELEADDGAHVAGLPAVDGSVDTLADILTAIIFRSGPYHSAVNYPQGDFFGDPGQLPAAAWADPRAVRQKDRADYLPPIEPGLTQAGVMFILSSIRHKTFSDYQMSGFEDPRVWSPLADLRVRLEEIEARIIRRNLLRPVPYPYLRPSLVSLAANV